MYKQYSDRDIVCLIKNPNTQTKSIVNLQIQSTQIIMKERSTIYHLVALPEFKAQIRENYYTPVFFENDGFIHCTGDKETSLLVLEDYFNEVAKSYEILIIVVRLNYFNLYLSC